MRRLHTRLAHLDRQLSEVLQQHAPFDSTSARNFLQKKIDQIRYRLNILGRLNSKARAASSGVE